MSKKRFTAFTLIELLVVVAIISILAALLMPALRSALDVARTAECMSNEKQIGIAVGQYIEDNRQYFPLAQYYTSKINNLGGWYGHIAPYVLDWDRWDNDIVKGENPRGAQIFLCPIAKNRGVFYSGWRSFNVSYGAFVAYTGMYNSAPNPAVRKHTSVSRPAQSIFLTGAARLNPAVWTGSLKVPHSTGRLESMHRNSTSMNVLWLDWHVTTEHEFYLSDNRYDLVKYAADE